MGKIRRIPKRLLFPLGGHVEAYALQHQPPYTTPKCLNVRPFDRAGRLRGGNRPGLFRRYLIDGVAGPLGTGPSPEIRFVSSMGIARSDGFSHWIDTFDHPPAGLYTIMPAGDWPGGTSFGFAGAGPAFLVSEGFSVVLQNSSAIELDVDARYHNTLDIDGAQPFSLALGTVPLYGYHRGTYYLIANWDGNSNYQNMLICSLDTFGLLADRGYYRLVFISIVGGTYAADETIGEFGDAPTSDSAVAEESHNTPGEFVFQIDGGDLKAFWYGQLIASHTPGGGVPAVSTRIGYGASCYVDPDSTWDPGASGTLNRVTMDYFRCHYFKSNPASYEDENKTIIVASAGGKIYKETNTFEVTDDSGSFNGDVANDRTLATQERHQLLYIADTGDPVLDSDEVDDPPEIGAVAGTSFDASNVPDWTYAAGINFSTAAAQETYVLEIYNGQSTAINGTYLITGAIVGNLTISPTGGTGACDFRIRRAPKIYNPQASTLVIWDTENWASGDPYPIGRKGSVPAGCPIVCLYRDRLVLAGNPPFVFYMSRVGDPHDFDISADADDTERAVGGLTDDVGVVGMYLTCVIPHINDYLIFASLNRMSMLRGDIGLGGEIDDLSREIGIVGRPGFYTKAWCYGPSGEIIFLSLDGIYFLLPGTTEHPVAVSRKLLPKQLFNIDADVYDVVLNYDTRYRGVEILVSREDEHQSYWLDWETKTFWPEKHGTRLLVGATHPGLDGKYSNVIWGSNDGHLLQYRDVDTADSGGVAIDSHVFIGPFMIGGSDYVQGILAELECVVSQTGSRIKWSLWVGDDAERVAQDATDSLRAADETGTFDKGSNYTAHPRRFGTAAILKLELSPNMYGNWSIEEIRTWIEIADIKRIY